MEYNTRLTSAELSQLWAAYMSDSANACMLKAFVNHVEDAEIGTILEHALDLAKAHIGKITDIFNTENYPIPVGFSEQQDVDPDAARLFSDSYMLYYVSQLSIMSLTVYASSVSTVTRSDVFSYFSECLSETNELLRNANESLLSKGLYVRPPYLPTPKTVDFVQSQMFLQGFFGDRRPLTGMEITNLFSNYLRNVLGVATLTGYSQVCQSKEVGKFMVRGKEIAAKHCQVFHSLLSEDDLPSPMSWDAEVTDSTTFIFSDKLMMFITSLLITAGFGYYGSSIASSARRDLGVQYHRLMAEVEQYSEDCANLLIKNGWMEEPPRAADRDKLANT
ncbi:DUF3231 family protein [Alkalihalobacillus sp. AL-G]|uniref:DUF3231 family protein n=1 Tax=Alkalihalobacillus sp. AL-G TaxID=2926399 RepID=UPI00272A631D|nr:DUF3231 family protein [Alkalihalobacillus sp. AL-G]WLD94593.1 DUF3231 family protein [Alkalihalobacillus sp. AL-G]